MVVSSRSGAFEDVYAHVESITAEFLGSPLYPLGQEVANSFSSTDLPQ
jgi:hypothetical protein